VDMAKAAAGAKVIQLPGRDRPAPAHGMRSVYVDDIQTVAVGDGFSQ
jgi:hypothetical protein